MGSHGFGVEIERKFLVTGDGWRGTAEGTLYRQGYIAISPTATVRVRIGGGTAILAIKGESSVSESLTRTEYEWPIPVPDAEQLIEKFTAGRIIEKTRYRIPFAGLIWEVDEFHGRHEGFIMAEVELERHDQAIEKPDWVGDDVTGDHRYSNAWLSTADT